MKRMCYKKTLNYKQALLSIMQNFLKLAINCNRSQNMSKIQYFVLILFSLALIGTDSARILQAFEQGNETKINKKCAISFEDYILKYQKTYENQAEKMQRCKIFEANVKKLGQSRCSACGINKFTDRTSEQIQKLRGFRTQQSQSNALLVASNSQNEGIFSSSATAQNSNTTNSTSPQTTRAPTSFDWRDYGVVTSVKNQFKCGVCWAFSTCAFFESQLIRRGQAKQNIDLSEQYLFQCDSLSYGCRGGNLYSPMDLILSGGIPFEANYPYNPNFSYSGICRIGKGPVFPFSSRVTVYSLTDSQVIQYLLQRPLNIGIKSINWQKYAPTDEDRTFECEEIKNGTKEYNHAVLLVGYTQTQWIVKNQWGKDWGLDGFIYISRNAKYNCGIGLEMNTLNYRLKPINIPNSIASNTKFNSVPQKESIQEKKPSAPPDQINPTNKKNK